LVATLVGAGLLLAPFAAPSAALAASGDAREASSVMATSLTFAGYREAIPPGSYTQTAITVAPTPGCTTGMFLSVGIGAQQAGTAGTLGATVYSQCIGGTQTIQGVFETSSGPVPMTTIGALAPGNVVAIIISTASGVTTVQAMGPGGTDTMSVPDILSSKYRVGAVPTFADHSPAKMPNFHNLSIYKNVVNSVALGLTSWTKVHMKYASGPKRVKTKPFNAYGDVFKLKWKNP
jgi:hypothetical protein